MRQSLFPPIFLVAKAGYAWVENPPYDYGLPAPAGDPLHRELAVGGDDLEAQLSVAGDGRAVVGFDVRADVLKESYFARRRQDRQG